MDKETDGQPNGQKNGHTNGWNFTNFKRNLAITVIYVPVNYEFDWTNYFGVTVRKRKMWRDRWTDKRTKNGKKKDKWMEFHQFRKEPSYDGDLFPCQV